MAGGLLESGKHGIYALKRKVKTTVLLIDSDLGFVFWLGRALDKAGYEAFPAKSIPGALKLIAELDLSVGLVIVNYSLPGSAEFFVHIRHKQRLAKIVGLVDDADVPIPPEVDWQCCKPAAIDETSKMELIRQIHGVLEPQALNHKNDAPALRLSATIRRTIM
jgi:hypothetical protein